MLLILFPSPLCISERYAEGGFAAEVKSALGEVLGGNTWCVTGYTPPTTIILVSTHTPYYHYIGEYTHPLLPLYWWVHTPPTTIILVSTHTPYYHYIGEYTHPLLSLYWWVHTPPTIIILVSTHTPYYHYIGEYTHPLLPLYWWVHTPLTTIILVSTHTPYYHYIGEYTHPLLPLYWWVHTPLFKCFFFFFFFIQYYKKYPSSFCSTSPILWSYLFFLQIWSLCSTREGGGCTPTPTRQQV